MTQPILVSGSPEGPYTLHIVLATTPLKDQAKYIDKIEQRFYNDYVSATDRYYRSKTADTLYKPLKYYMFGHYDVAFISVIDSFKFAQKLFMPEDQEVQDTFNPISFQVITGICLLHSHQLDDPENSSIDLPTFFQRLQAKGSKSIDRLFLSVINLKINNGLLIGNGRVLLQAVVEKTDEILRQFCQEGKGGQLSYVILQSFSWHELNVVCFIEDLGFISTILQSLRILTLGDLPDAVSAAVVKKSLYGVKEKDVKVAISTLHLFADSQTYLGLDYSVIEEKPEKNVAEALAACKVETETEWKVKPGYSGQLFQALVKEGFATVPEQEGETTNFVLTGKTDYVMPGVRTKLADSVRLFQWLLSGKDNIDVIRHVRKIKTRILIPAHIDMSSVVPGKPDYQDLIDSLRIKEEEITAADAGLKRQKISHQLRNKVKRILFIFNNEIQDHILFPYFVDFYWFIRRLLSDCFADGSGSMISIPKQEEKLIQYIRSFEEGHRLRVLNSYQFEEVNDFDLDFSASIQQLLSIYHSVILSVSNLFYPQYAHCPVVQLNWNDSIATPISIHYNIHHLLSPEFVFSTISMDILEPNFREKKGRDQLNILREAFDKTLDEDEFLQQYKNSNLIDFVTLLADAVRFVFTFNAEEKLFRFWLWNYDFQNPALFKESGSMDENFFKVELFRFVFVYQLFGHGALITEESCPVAEIQTYWSRYYFKTKRAIAELLKTAISIEKDLPGENEIVFKKNETVAAVFKKLLCIQLTDPIRRQLMGTKKDGILGKWRRTFESDFEEGGAKLSAIDDMGRDASLLKKYFENRDECLRLFHRRMRDGLLAGVPIYYEDATFFHSAIYLASMMYSYLTIIAEKNGYEVKVLRRNWATGDPIDIFINAIKDERIYSVDPLGNLFFDSRTSHQQYFLLRNALLRSLWHFTMEQKKLYLDHIFNTPKKQG